jgi:hypothetical protein
MTFLELFTIAASGATLFGLIVGVFSVYNGRMTRRDVTALTRETQQLIRESHADTRQLIHEEMVATREILLRITEILARIDERVR